MQIIESEKLDKALKFHQTGDFNEAEKIYREIIQLSPKNFDALNLLGLLKFQQKKFDEAVFYIQKALELRPCAEFCINLGKANFARGDFQMAVDCFKLADSLKPNDFEVKFNLALAYKNNKNYDVAIKFYNDALVLKPDDADVYFNLGNVYENSDDTRRALEYYQKAKQAGIKNSYVDYFLAVSYLKLKDFKLGWEYYEYRPSKEFAIATQAKIHPDILTKPIYCGEEDASQKTLFVYYEAALGDSLMYARYLPLLAKRFKKVYFKPQHCFLELFKKSDLGVEILEVDEIDFEFDYHLPLMGVQYALGLNSESDIPYPDGFLKADSKKIQEYKEKFFITNKIKIGIKWQGNPAYDRQRIIPLEAFYKIFELENIQFYSLQKGEGEEELKNLPENFNVIDLAPTFNDFTDTAAAIENLDILICNDTSLAHLAGALGKKCYVLLPYVSNWRWHDDLSYSPWYKSVKLIKQTTPDNWTGVFEKLYQDLN